MDLPWKRPELEGWLIVGMNHYIMNDRIWLFVVMSKQGRCIKVEGLDMPRIWDDLASEAKISDGG